MNIYKTYDGVVFKDGNEEFVFPKQLRIYVDDVNTDGLFNVIVLKRNLDI